jgi:hypothetical protein
VDAVVAVVAVATVVVAAAVVVAADVATKHLLLLSIVFGATTPKPHTPNRGDAMLSNAEQSVLKVFRQFLMQQGEMLCFQGPLWEKHKTSLRQLTERDFLFQESFKGGYSLTKSGFAAMRTLTAA